MYAFIAYGKYPAEYPREKWADLGGSTSAVPSTRLVSESIDSVRYMIRGLYIFSSPGIIIIVLYCICLKVETETSLTLKVKYCT